MTNERDNKALHKHCTYEKGLSLEKISTFKLSQGRPADINILISFFFFIQQGMKLDVGCDIWYLSCLKC